MDPITLITSAMTMLSPYIVKSGEKLLKKWEQVCGLG